MNTFGDLYKTSIYGESHGKMVGVVIDGVPSGTKIDLDLLNNDLLRRKPSGAGETKRQEADAPVIYSGVYNGFATGAPIHIGFVNENQRFTRSRKTIRKIRNVWTKNVIKLRIIGNNNKNRNKRKYICRISTKNSRSFRF